MVVTYYDIVLFWYIFVAPPFVHDYFEYMLIDSNQRHHNELLLISVICSTAIR